MRAISKGQEPRSLTEHRNGQWCNYDNYQGKDDLRQALIIEQRGLCCYCMGRIRQDINHMKIEHWKCQVFFPQDQLNYTNLLGSCMGGEGQPQNLQCCDTRKKNLELKWNPAIPNHMIETRIKYGPDGLIRSDDPIFDDQLNEVLNLNLPVLKNNRKGVLDAVLEWWKKRKPMPPENIEREIRRRDDSNGELQPYCQVAVWWLRKKLAR
jgi:uncharacterized protein (TIGR02646 family)